MLQVWDMHQPQSLLPGTTAFEMGVASPVHSPMTQVLLLLLLPLTQPAGLRSRGLTASRASRV